MVSYSHLVLFFIADKVSTNSLTLIYKDKDLGLTYTAKIDCIWKSMMYLLLEAKIESKNPIIMEWLSAPVIEASQTSNEMLTMGVTGAANLEDRQRHGSQELT